MWRGYFWPVPAGYFWPAPPGYFWPETPQLAPAPLLGQPEFKAFCAWLWRVREN